jgi:hypothetical protein
LILAWPRFDPEYDSEHDVAPSSVFRPLDTANASFSGGAEQREVPAAAS